MITVEVKNELTYSPYTSVRRRKGKFYLYHYYGYLCCYCYNGYHVYHCSLFATVTRMYQKCFAL
jgi:hypothetical protein